MNSSMLRKTFDQILRSTVVPATMPLETKIQTYGQWTEFLGNNIPIKLFRYRNYNIRSLEAFYHDQVGVTIGSKMNDGFDTRIYFGLKNSDRAIRDEFSDERLIQFYNLIINENCPFHAFLKQYLYNAGYTGDISEIDNNPFILNAKSLRDMVLSKQSEVLHEIIGAAQSTIKFACFSEDIKSPVMWGQYAGDEEGFALQYDFTKQVSPNEISDNRILKSIQTYPIIYNKDRFHVPHEYVMYLFKYRMTYALASMYGSSFPYGDFRSILPAINPCPDEAMTTKIMLHKSNEWKNEKEWRVICNSDDFEYQQAEYSYFKKAPTAVYLGRRMKQNSRKLLIDIARKKGIPVYEMLINDDSPKYLLKVKRLVVL